MHKVGIVCGKVDNVTRDFNASNRKVKILLCLDKDSQIPNIHLQYKVEICPETLFPFE